MGVSFNKVFAKLASDLKKPDAVTVVDRGNFQEKLYGLAVTDLLYVGKATAEKLRRMGIKTIGALAAADESLLHWGNGASRYRGTRGDWTMRPCGTCMNVRS